MHAHTSRLLNNASRCGCHIFGRTRLYLSSFSRVFGKVETQLFLKISLSTLAKLVTTYLLFTKKNMVGRFEI